MCTIALVKKRFEYCKIIQISYAVGDQKMPKFTGEDREVVYKLGRYL